MCLSCARHGCIRATCAWARVVTMCQAWVHSSDMRVVACAHHVPGMGAFERHARGRVCLSCARHGCIRATCAWAGVVTTCQAWVHLSDTRVGGCAYHVQGMGAFERHAHGRVCLPCVRHGCIRATCAWAGVLTMCLGAFERQALRICKNVTSKVMRNVRKERLRGPNAELRFVARVAGVGNY